MSSRYVLGVYEKALPGELSLSRKFLYARNTGFDAFELSIDETDERLGRLKWDNKMCRSIRTISEDNGVQIGSICLSAHRRFPLGSHDALQRKVSVDILKRTIEIASEVGARMIQLAGYDVYYEKHDDYTEKQFVESITNSVEYASSAGVLLGFETMETSFMDTVQKAMHYVKIVGSPYLGIYPDIGNLKNASTKYDIDIIDDISSGTGHIFAAHLKETRPGVYRNLFFGDGYTDYEGCITELLKQGVRRFTAEFWYQGEQNYIENLHRASSFLRAIIDGKLHETDEIVLQQYDQETR